MLNWIYLCNIKKLQNIVICENWVKSGDGGKRDEYTPEMPEMFNQGILFSLVSLSTWSLFWLNSGNNGPLQFPYCQRIHFDMPWYPSTTQQRIYWLTRSSYVSTYNCSTRELPQPTGNTVVFHKGFLLSGYELSALIRKISEMWYQQRNYFLKLLLQ